MADNTHSLATYVSDMLALERHIRVPFDTQNKDSDFSEYPDAAELVLRMSATADEHIERLKTTLDDLGGHEASPVKSAVAQFEGAVAGAIDKMRKTKVSKALRDDYTALSLCCVSYSELLSTANAMGDTKIASLAQRLLRDYSQLVMEIGHAIPSIVVLELQAIGLTVDLTTIDLSRSQIHATWQDGTRQSRETDTTIQGTIETRTSRTL